MCSSIALFKLPAGAVSMFGGAPNPLAAALKSQRPPSDQEVCLNHIFYDKVEPRVSHYVAAHGNHKYRWNYLKISENDLTLKRWPSNKGKVSYGSSSNGEEHNTWYQIAVV